MNKEEILRRSREENRKGDEYEKTKKEVALNNSYLAATVCLSLLAISFYLNFASGSIVIGKLAINLEHILWAILFLINLVECASKYTYFKKKRYLFYTLFWLAGLIMAIIAMFKR